MLMHAFFSFYVWLSSYIGSAFCVKPNLLIPLNTAVMSNELKPFATLWKNEIFLSSALIQLAL